jgi:hypothetical protein
MDVALILCDAAMVLLAPAAGIGALWLKRRWHIALLICAAALLSWGILLFSESLVDAAAVAAFNRIPNPTDAQIRDFTADGATKGFFFVLGLPFFLLYGLVWFALVRVGRRLIRRQIHA